MEIHDRLRELPTTGINILEIVASNADKKSSIIHDLVVTYNEKIFNGTHDLRTLETFRMILAYDYQCLTNSLVKDDSLRCKGQTHIDLKRFFPKDKEYVEREEFFVLYDIVVLQFVLYSNKESLLESFKNFCDDSELLATPQGKDLAMRVSECFADSYNLHNYLYKSTTSLAELEEQSARILTIVQRWMKQEETVDWKLLAVLLPKLIIAFDPEKIISPLWLGVIGSPTVVPKVDTKQLDDSTDLDEKLTALCVLADVCFPTDKVRVQTFHYEQCVQYEFWWILNRGMLSAIPQQRKQALYLMKRATEFADSHESQIARQSSADEEAERIKKSDKIGMPFPCARTKAEQSSLDKMKKIFFLVLEVLEEKQKHLVLPTLSHLPYLTKVQDGHESDLTHCLNPIWVRCIFRRIVQHDNYSIKLFGLQEILKCDTAIFLDDEFLRFLVCSLNNTFSYNITDDCEEPQIVMLLRECLCKWESDETTLINKFVREVSSLSWNQVSIYWILIALNGVGKRCQIVTNKWSNSELRCVENLVKENLISNCMKMRKYFHLLINDLFQSFTSMSADPLNCDCIFSLLFSFPEDKYWKRGSTLWIRIIENLPNLIKITNAQRYVVEKCDKILKTEENLQSFGPEIVLLLDSQLIFVGNGCPAKLALQNLFQNLVDADMRPYADQRVITKILELASHLNLALNDSYPCRKDLELFMTPYGNEIFKIVTRSVEKKNVFNYEKYLFAIEILGKINGWPGCMRDGFKQLREKCIRVIGRPMDSCPIQWLYAVKMLYLCNEIMQQDFHSRESLEPHVPLLLNHYVTVIVTINDGKNYDHVAHADDKPRGKIISDYSEIVGKIMWQSMPLKSMTVESCRTTWLDEIWFNALCRLVEMADERNVITMSSILQELLKISSLLTKNNVFMLDYAISVLWRNIFHLRRTSAFTSAMPSVIELIINREYLKLDGAREFVDDCICNILEAGERGYAVCDQFLKALYHCDEKYNLPWHRVYMNWLRHVVESNDQKREFAMLCHGQRTFPDYPIVCDHCVDPKRNLHKNFPSNDEMYENTNHETDHPKYCEESGKLLSSMKRGLSNFEKTMINELLEILESVKNKRYFDNSILHGLKNRVMQNLLILEPQLDDMEAKRLHDVLSDLLIAESNQPSVRLMHEWLLVRLYLGNENLRDAIWTVFETAAEKRPGSVVSLAGIVFHVARKLSGKTQMEFIGKAIERLLPNCMGQQFNVRLYSQAIIVKIYEMLPDDSPQAETHRGIFVGVRESLRRGNLMKNFTRVFDDFYFDVFDPVQDFNTETIFHELPRLTNVVAYEWISLETLQNTFASHVPKNSRRELRMAKSSAKSCKPTGDLTESVNSNADDGPGDIQKKIIPWKTMIPFYNELSENSRNELSRGKFANDERGIIVVASLIDRPPNLGGLARSCEIFGAKELVIGSLRYVEDRKFQTLSVSAEKWITITEVKPHLLKNYLLEKESEGWKLVGAEQTANSHNLVEMKFPEKTILVLGNEGDGIPANLIPLLDSCVEIPQHGVVRSLNVHVTGAICLWQYAKQHVFA